VSGPAAYGLLVRVEVVTSERWDHLEAVLGSAGGDGGCWDMFWRLTASEYAASSKDRNRALLRGLVEADPKAPGLVAYCDGEPAGWISVGPRAGYRRLARSRHFAPLDDQDVFSVICLRVTPAHRGMGVALALIHAAVEHARECGATAVEAYPVRTNGRRLKPTEAYCGTLDLFTEAGFQVVRQHTGAVSGGSPRMVVRRFLT
jgi:GNAT superfamily N-acetyltransferase